MGEPVRRFVFEPFTPSAEHLANHPLPIRLIPEQSKGLTSRTSTDLRWPGQISKVKHRMKTMRCTLLTVAAAALSLSAESHAQDSYIAGQFGIRAVEQTDGEAGNLAIESELGNASFFSVALGRDTGNWRYEVELARRGGKINNFSIGGTEQAVSGDGLSATSLMANAFIDFNEEGRFSPYIGAGLGLASVTADYSAAGGTIDGQSSAFAFQLIGGASVQVSERVELFSDLRYMRAMETDHALTAPLGSSDVSFQYDGYTLGAGVRVSY